MYRLILTVSTAYKVSPGLSQQANVVHKKVCDGEVFMHTLTSREPFMIMIQNNKGITIAFISAEKMGGEGA